MASPAFWRPFWTAMVLFACAGAIGWIGILHYHLSAWWMLVPVIIIGSVYSYFYPQRQQ
jgi:hypothetical protein